MFVPPIFLQYLSTHHCKAFYQRTQYLSSRLIKTLNTVSDFNDVLYLKTSQRLWDLITLCCIFNATSNLPAFESFYKQNDPDHIIDKNKDEKTIIAHGKYKTASVNVACYSIFCIYEQDQTILLILYYSQLTSRYSISNFCITLFCIWKQVRSNSPLNETIIHVN